MKLDTTATLIVPNPAASSVVTEPWHLRMTGDVGPATLTGINRVFAQIESLVPVDVQVISTHLEPRGLFRKGELDMSGVFVGSRDAVESARALLASIREKQ